MLKRQGCALRIYFILEMKLLASILGLAAAQWETNYAPGHGGKRKTILWEI